MGSIFSVSGPSRMLAWKRVLERTSDFSYGKPFVEMIQDHPQYGPWINVKTTYEVRLVHLESHHWYLLVRTKDSTLSYISLEIRTTDLSDLVPFTRGIDSPKLDVSSDVGSYEGTLFSLCELADSVVKEMGSYELLTSNCQTFCNQLLKKMGKTEFPTTIVTEFIDKELDLLGEVIIGRSPSKATNCLPTVSYVKLNTIKQKRSSSRATSAAGITAKQPAAKELDLVLPKNVPSLSIDDLSSLYKILIPIQHDWREIGDKLAIDPQTLETIGTSHFQIAEQCLREMLREYLQRPSPSWVDLANAVKEHNPQSARAIIKRAENIQQTAV